MNIDLKVEEILMVIIAFVIGYVLSRVLSSNNIFKTPTKKIYGKHKTKIVGLGEQCNKTFGEHWRREWGKQIQCKKGLDCINDTDSGNTGLGICKKLKKF